MSDTPRTDVFESHPRGLECDCHEAIDFARQLECELAAMTAERDSLRTDRDAFKREFLKAVEACSFMQDEPAFSHLFGEATTSDGVRHLKKQRDENKAGWDTCRLVALRLERERNEARECLREKLFDCIANQKSLTGYEPASPATVYLEPRSITETGKV